MVHQIVINAAEGIYTAHNIPRSQENHLIADKTGIQTKRIRQIRRTNGIVQQDVAAGRVAYSRGVGEVSGRGRSINPYYH
jgi:hypothetical protein